MFNPRFPHSLRIWRACKDDYGQSMTDDEGNPIYDVVRIQKAVVVDGFPMMCADGSFRTESVEWIEFGYRTQGKNTKETTDVMVSDYKLATAPLLTFLEPGDRVEVKDFTRTFWGEVVKMATFNLGTNIWINEIMN